MNDTKVYVVMYDREEPDGCVDTGIVKVFATWEAADRFKEERAERFPNIEYYIEECQVEN